MALRPERYAGTGVFLASFTVFLLTLAPVVTFWDSGELIYGAVTLGIPHPPAYPLFCILGKGLYLLPFGNAAYRLNLMSALLGSLCSYIIFRLVHEMGGGSRASTPVAVSAALFFAFSEPFWAQAVVAEVYTLNSVLLASIAYLLFRYDKEGGQAYLHASAFALGMAFANHQSAVFLAPVYAAYYLYAGGIRKDPKRLLISLFFMMFGYSAMLYLPVRASAGPMINIGDPDTLYGFLWVVKLLEHAATLKNIPARLATVATGGAAIAAAGGLLALVALALALRKRPYIGFLLFASVFYLGGMYILTFDYQDIFRWGLYKKFYIPAILYAVPAGAVLVYWLSRAAGRGNNKAPRTAPALALAAWALLALPAASLYANWQETDNSRNFFAFDFATNTLKSAMPDGALFAWGDNGVFPVWYMQGVERYRQDVLFMHTELLTHDWYMYDTRLKIYEKFGVDFIPPAPLTQLRSNIPPLKSTLEERTPTYFDYSAASMMGMDLSRLKPQGLVHLVNSWKAEKIGRIWASYVMRGAFDGSTNKEFAAEGILAIYGYEMGIWAQQAYAEGRPEEALIAYDTMVKLGTKNKYLEIWAERTRRELQEKKNN